MLRCPVQLCVAKLERWVDAGARKEHCYPVGRHQGKAHELELAILFYLFRVHNWTAANL